MLKAPTRGQRRKQVLSILHKHGPLQIKTIERLMCPSIKRRKLQLVVQRHVMLPLLLPQLTLNARQSPDNTICKRLTISHRFQVAT